MLKRFSKETLLYLPAQLVPALLAFISIPLFTRMLSTGEFGRYTLLISSIGVMSILLSWLQMAVSRFYPALPQAELPILVRTALLALIGFGVVIGLMAYGGSYLALTAESSYRPLIGIGVLIFIFQGVFFLLAQVLRARLRPGVYSLFVVWERCATLGLSVLFVASFGLGVPGMLWAVVLGSVSALPWLWRQVFQGVRTIGPISAPMLRELAAYGLPLTIGQLGGWVLHMSDRYQIQAFYSAREVGMFAAAYTLASHSITVYARLIRLSSDPLLYKTWEQKGQEATRQFLNAITRLYLLVGIPLVVGMSVLAKPTMQVLTGADFASGYSIIPWVASGAFFLGLQYRFNQTLTIIKRTRVIMMSIIVAGVINLGLNYWLLPIWGYQIAAVTTLVSYVILCAMQAAAASYYFRWPFPWASLSRSLIAAAIMSGGLVYFQLRFDFRPIWTLCLAVPSGGLIYGAALCGLGELSTRERQVITAFLKRQRTVRTVETSDPPTSQAQKTE